MSDDHNVVDANKGAGNGAGANTDSPEARAAKALVAKFPENQQGMHDWARDAAQRHAAIIRLALADPLPVEKDLRAELEAAGERFDLKPIQVWRVVQTRYREGDAYLLTLCQDFVGTWKRELQDEIERERLGEIDDEEDLLPERTGEPEPQSVQIRAKTREFIAEIHKQTGHSADVRAQLRVVMSELARSPRGRQARKFGCGPTANSG
jgi:hypothetical protein